MASTAAANAATAAATAASTLAADVDPLATATVVANDVAQTAQAAATVAQAAPAAITATGDASGKVSKASVGFVSGLVNVWARIFSKTGGVGIMVVGILFILVAVVSVAASKSGTGGRRFGYGLGVLGFLMGAGGAYLFARRGKKASAE